MNEPALSRGDTLEVTIDRMAHGGLGIGHAPDGRVVFVPRAFPGDTVRATAGQVKKSFIKGELDSIVAAGELRVPSSCPAAELGAGCCDFAELDPAAEPAIEMGVLREQLRRSGIEGLESLAIEQHDLPPVRGWRTRVRLGVDKQGRAGLRKYRSNELVTSVGCTQLADGLIDGLVGDGARRFTPGAEIVAVLDGAGNRHVVETRKAPRGRRVETIREVIEGSGTVVEHVNGRVFSFPATAFWQAHVAAPELYSAVAGQWLAGRDYQHKTAWDLYGGVGLFAPALSDATGGKVISVDYSPAATASTQPGLRDIDIAVKSARVEQVAAQLPQPGAVVLDPPRTGAGEQVIRAVAGAKPQAVVHVGCDPATFARDLSLWHRAGYKPEKMALINAFPGTHHFEVIALITPDKEANKSAQDAV